MIFSRLTGRLLRLLTIGAVIACATTLATPLCQNNVSLYTLKNTNGGICDLGVFYQVHWESGAYANASVNDRTVTVSWSNVSLTSLQVDFIANNAATGGIGAKTFGDTSAPANPTTNGQSKVTTASINFFYTVTALTPFYGIVQETIGADAVETKDQTAGKAVASTSDFVAQKYVRDAAGNVLGLALSDGLSATNDVEDLSGTSDFQGEVGTQFIQEQLFLTNRKTKINGTVYASKATVGTGTSDPGDIENSFVFRNVLVPEPFSMILTGCGFFGLALLRRRLPRR